MGEATAGGIPSEKTLKLLGKIKAKQWKEMGKTVSELKEFTDIGGAATIDSFIGEIKETFNLQISDMLAPLKNELDELINTILLPAIPIIQDFTNWILPFMTDLRKMMQGFLDNDLPAMLDGAGKDFGKFLSDWKNNFDQFSKDWEAFWRDPLGALNQFNKDYNAWAAGVGQDIGKMWSGFWRDLGWK